MSSSQANELVTTSGSQKKIWISWKDEIEGTDRRKEKRKPVQTKLRIYMIWFFPIQTFVGDWYRGVATKIGFKTKVNNYKYNWWTGASKEPKITTWPWLIKRPIIFARDTVWHESFARVYFCGLAIFCILRELIFAIRIDWFFLLGINFCDFIKYPVLSIDNIFVFIEYVQ